MVRCAVQRGAGGDGDGVELNLNTEVLQPNDHLNVKKRKKMEIFSFSLEGFYNSLTVSSN